MRPAEKRRRRRKAAVIGWLAALVVGAAMLIPYALVRAGSTSAIECIRGYEAPRGPELPWCGDSMKWFSFPARVPWTVTPATYRAEELRIRIAVGHYRNAIAGQPNREARAKAAELMEQAQTIVKTGSQRLAFEELGPALGAPQPAQDALLLGDRDALLAKAKDWGEWHQRLHTLQAALIEGDFPRALDVARHYATYDPREEDLRSAIGAILCLGGDTKRGMEMFVLQQNDRAARRYAAMSRNWGDVRTALLACAALGGTTPPPRPPTSEAGQDDQREVRMPLRLRVVEDHDHRLIEAQEAAQTILTGPLSPGARAPILAALLATGKELSPETWADLATARAAEGEGPLLDLGSVNVLSWLEVPRERPIVTASVLRAGAEKLAQLAEGAPDGARGALATAAGALWIEGARASVRAADAKGALDMLERAAPLVRMDPATRALAEAIVRYATGDVDGARATLSRAPLDGVDPDLLAAALTLTAEVSGDWAPPVTAAAMRAAEAAQKTKSAAIQAWARRVKLWGAPDSVPPSTATIESVDPMAGRFALWPSLGYSNRTVQWGAADDLRLGLLDRNLAVWSSALRAKPEDQRAFRYAFLRHRGDMPDAVVPYLGVAQKVTGEGGDPEVWLDAVMATDAPRFSARVYTWARAQAARARGDREAHARWTSRYLSLAKLIGDDNKAELARFLGI